MFVQQLYSIYNQFLSNFPDKYHGWVSVGLAGLLFFGIYKVVRKQLVYLVLLVVLLPASIPILKNIWEQLLEFLKFLLNRKAGG